MGILYANVQVIVYPWEFLFRCSFASKNKVYKSIEKTHMSRVGTNSKLSTFVPLTLFFSKFHLVIGCFCIKVVFTVIHP